MFFSLLTGNKYVAVRLTNRENFIIFDYRTENINNHKKCEKCYILNSKPKVIYTTITECENSTKCENISYIHGLTLSQKKFHWCFDCVQEYHASRNNTDKNKCRVRGCTKEKLEKGRRLCEFHATATP